MKSQSPPLSTSEAVRGRHRIGAVAEQTGLSQHAIRVWERRYGAVKPHRTEGGSRLYSDDDIHRLQLLRQLTSDGHTISALAPLPTPQLLTIAGAHPPAPTSELGGWGEQFLDATRQLDSAAIENVLARAAGQMSPRQLVTELVAPLATEIGHLWQRGDLSIAQEHAATAALRDLLTRLRRNYNATRGEPVALAATLSGEKHELGLLMAALLCAMDGWNTVYLGTEMPAEQLIEAVEKAEARLLLLSMVAAGGFEQRAVLRELRDRLPNDVEIVVGGRAAFDAPGLQRVRSLEEFESKIKELTSH